MPRLTPVVVCLLGVLRSSPARTARYGFAAAAAIFFLHATPAFATTYYVATDGKLTNSGTEAAPFRTIAQAVDMMVAGDTTFVKSGTYNEETIRFRRSGTEAAPIKLLNYPKHAPKIVFIDPDKIHRIIIQHSAGANVAMGWITIEGFEIMNGHDGIKWHSLHDSKIQRNWIHDNKFMGMLGIGGARILINQNMVDHNGNFPACATNSATCNQHHGLYAHGSFYTVTNNVFFGNLAFGVQQNGSSDSVYDPAKHALPEFSGAADWVIAHNTFAYNVNRGGIVVWGSRCTNSRIINNIFYENSVDASGSPQGIEFVGAGSATGISIRNNLAYATAPGNTGFLGRTGATEGINYTQSGNLVNMGDPAFVNGGNGVLLVSPDFSLTSSSPAIDQGLTLGEVDVEVDVDFDGKARPQGRAYDIGAYEFADGDRGKAGGDVSEIDTGGATDGIGLTEDGSGRTDAGCRTAGHSNAPASLLCGLVFLGALRRRARRPLCNSEHR